MTFDEHDVTPVHGEREILERVHKRGTTLRRRKRIARATSAMVVVVVLVGGIAFAYRGGPTKPTSGGFVNSTAPTVSETPTDTPIEIPTVNPTEEPPPSDTPSEQPSPSDSAPVCVNSFDPACGPFYWDPPPGPNAPITATIHASSTTLTVGETVNVTATASDPDAKDICHTLEWGPTSIGFARTWLVPHGRWVTPEKAPGYVSETYTHAYDAPGKYLINFTAISGWHCPSAYDPYGSYGGASVTVTVVDASPSPSPSVSDSPSPSPSVSESPSPSASPT